MVASPARGLEAAAWLIFATLLALALASVLPFWNGLAAVMGGGAIAVAARLHAAGRPVFAPRALDTLLGLALGVAAWGAVRLLWAPLMALAPGLAVGLVLVGGHAASQPLAWAVVSMAVIATGEELVWRWYLPWRLADRWPASPYVRAAACALPYAAVHLFTGRLLLVPPALGFGLLWGWLTVWRGGPWAAIVFHVVFDWLVFLVAPPAVPAPGI